ncbi:hypothetical protein HYW87_03330 [Candidatus Roizmanbacteria bacterium]|nr:hypothetical protein [Candidatus Roizmanbacteria bacterium]
MISRIELGLKFLFILPLYSYLSIYKAPAINLKPTELEELKSRLCINCPFYKGTKIEQDKIWHDDNPGYPKMAETSLGIVCQGLTSLSYFGEAEVQFLKGAGKDEQDYFLANAKCAPIQIEAAQD